MSLRNHDIGVDVTFKKERRDEAETTSSSSSSTSTTTSTSDVKAGEKADEKPTSTSKNSDKPKSTSTSISTSSKTEETNKVVHELIEPQLHENCKKLDQPSTICLGTDQYPIGKSVNVNETDNRIKDLLNKSGREGIDSEDPTCFLNLRKLLCLIEYQKCSSDGSLIPVCSSIKKQTIDSCSQKSKFLDEKSMKEIINESVLSDNKNCFSGWKSLAKPFDASSAAKEGSNDEKNKSKSDANNDSDESNPKLNSEHQKINSDDEPDLHAIPSLGENESIERFIIHSKQADDDKCFLGDGFNADKLPDEKSVVTGELSFVIREEVDCIDRLNVTKIKLSEPCACDSRLISVRSSCENADHQGDQSSKRALIFSFRDVKTPSDAETLLPKLNFGLSDTPLRNLHSRDVTRKIDAAAKGQTKEQQTAEDATNEEYFNKFYYPTCNRLIGVPPSGYIDKCASHAQFDNSEKTKSNIYFMSTFNQEDIKKQFRTGCSLRQCLRHLKYSPPSLNPESELWKIKTDDNKKRDLSHKPRGHEDKSTTDEADNDNVCIEDNLECPEWNFEQDEISTGGLEANLTSYLELNVEAFANSTRPSIIYSFRSLADPVYEGLRFLLDGIPAMDLVYNQSDFLGYAVPLVPGRTHLARWEFVRGELSETSGFASTSIQAIVLRDAKIASNTKQPSNWINELKAHHAPQAPLQSLGRSKAIQQDTQLDPIESTGTSFIPVLIVFIVLGLVGLIGWFIWRRHLCRPKSQTIPLDSLTPPHGFADRVAQLSGTRSPKYSPLDSNTVSGRDSVQDGRLTPNENAAGSSRANLLASADSRTSSPRFN